MCPAAAVSLDGSSSNSSGDGIIVVVARTNWPPELRPSAAIVPTLYSAVRVTESLMVYVAQRTSTSPSLRTCSSSSSSKIVAGLLCQQEWLYHCADALMREEEEEEAATAADGCGGCGVLLLVVRLVKALQVLAAANSCCCPSACLHPASGTAHYTYQ